MKNGISIEDDANGKMLNAQTFTRIDHFLSILYSFLCFVVHVFGLGFCVKTSSVTFCGNILKRVKIAFGGLEPCNWLVE